MAYFHLALAALRAISFRRFPDNAFARARPPIAPSWAAMDLAVGFGSSARWRLFRGVLDMVMSLPRVARSGVRRVAA